MTTLRLISPAQAAREHRRLLMEYDDWAARTESYATAARYLRAREAQRAVRNGWRVFYLIVATGLPLLVWAHWAGR